VVETLVEMAQLSTKPLTNRSETTKNPWKQGLVTPQAVATELRLADLAQWVFFVCDRFKE